MWYVWGRRENGHRVFAGKPEDGWMGGSFKMDLKEGGF
jgi:hypothetical protein